MHGIEKVTDRIAQDAQAEIEAQLSQAQERRTKFWRSMRPRRGRRWNVFWRMGRERWTRTVPNCTAWHGWRRGNEFWQPSRM